jgi:hypothetical protein
MKINVLLVILATAGVSACQGGNAKSQATAAGKANETGGTPVTLVGCLVPGNVGTQNGTVGTSGNSGAPGFTLIDVNTTSSTDGRSYSLIGDKDKLDDMQKLLNSRVEVTGFAAASPDAGAAAPDASSAPAPASTPSTDLPRVRVDQVKQVESSCR